ncbi:MerR family transcriptional regulator [Nocardioides sp. zg-1308]|uniref:DICT sensory domain-containing protein n=1 Tax=Nocardioides renjunii TaxID=3095075 RepID=A0ABU5KAX3_9ACTN|nr:MULTISPECIES: DICT sensory domain-containing protein [unclassified Nocardioides]MDZ5661584.1 DICT sensory domain-containing protein [Nocardioides sp. S-58]NPD04689.1 MerR family transcriptional regulator [Nocardioides sp. zg-1308]WQQ22582.1 DICT sensory domain-containing protein [Nocardioides sp. S-34]
MTVGASEGFSIGVLAARTGLTPAVLRTWENRYGFPAGQRSPTGHRRFTEADVRQVREVLDVRASGVPLQVAIDSVARRSSLGHDSVHAALSADFPELRPQRLGRRALIAASHAVEDESLARADRPVVLGSFQEGHRYSRSRHRWDELARTASWAAVVADFDEALPADPAARPARCQLPEDSALRREWTVVTVSATRAAVVSAWEVPGAPDRDPVFESVISTHRPAALAAARVLVGAARASGATPPGSVDDLLDDPAPAPATPPADVDRMWLRALARLDPPR